METKLCPKCNKELNVDSFCKNKRKKDGLNIYCKQCAEEQRKKYRIENKEKVIIANKNYWLKNKTRITETTKIYESNNKEKIAIRKKQYGIDNRETIYAKRRENYQNNKELYRLKNRLYNKKNKEKLSIAWRISCHKRKALKLSLPNTLTKEQWGNIKRHFDNKCCYCGKELPLEQEHFIPLTKGGEFTINNIICACRSCNSSKGNREFNIWYPKHKYYSKKREIKLLKFLGYENETQQIKLI